MVGTVSRKSLRSSQIGSGPSLRKLPILLSRERIWARYLERSPSADNPILVDPVDGHAGVLVILPLPSALSR
jgi:hypothetical protein